MLQSNQLDSLCCSGVNGVGIFPVIPLIIGGAATVGGIIGYNVGSPEYDKNGNRLPTVVETATGNITKGVGNAITIAALAAVGYFIFLDSARRRTK
jgi:hypothetical protein